MLLVAGRETWKQKNKNKIKRKETNEHRIRSRTGHLVGAASRLMDTAEVVEVLGSNYTHNTR